MFFVASRRSETDDGPLRSHLGRYPGKDFGAGDTYLCLESFVSDNIIESRPEDLEGVPMTRIAGFAISAILCVTSISGQEDEAKKKRLLQILKELTQLQTEADKLLRELSGGDPQKHDALLKELLEKAAPGLSSDIDRARLIANERAATTSLKTLTTAEANFRANDRDNNRVNDFWTADVSGLHRIDANGPIKLIDQELALADARPSVAPDIAGLLPGVAKEHSSKFVALGKRTPKAGYWFISMVKIQEEKGSPVKYDQGNGRNTSAFGFCAYPAEHGKTGRFTYIVNEDNVVWRLDAGGKAVEEFPANPERAGWSRVVQ